MAPFKVTAVGNEGKPLRDYESKKDGATMYVFAVKVEGQGDVVHEVSRKSDKPPDVGAEYKNRHEADNPDHRPRLSGPISDYQGGQGAKRGQGYSPADIAAMRRSGAQDRALRIFEIEGRVPSKDELLEWTAWFEGQVAEAAAAA